MNRFVTLPKSILTAFLFCLPLLFMFLFIGSHQAFADEQGLPITSPITIPITVTGCTPKPPCALVSTPSACRLPKTPAGGWCN
jgi:hypothetical protein